MNNASIGQQVYRMRQQIEINGSTWTSNYLDASTNKTRTIYLDFSLTSMFPFSSPSQNKYVVCESIVYAPQKNL